MAQVPPADGALRVAFWNVEMQRRGPGLLLRDILARDPQTEAVAEVVGVLRPDVLVLASVDWDLRLAALGALADRLEEAGAAYPYRFALRPNTGEDTGLDLDGDGTTGGPRDAQGYGRFAGQGGLALLSRHPVEAGAARDLTGFLWRDLPGALLDTGTDAPLLGPEAMAVQRLSSTGHWIVPVRLPSGTVLSLMIWHATPPVFDGPEDRNGRRNHDEAALWLALLDGRLPDLAPPEAPFVLLGDANLDPQDGEGRPEAVRALLSHPRLQDPAPESAGAVAAATEQGGVNALHRGPAGKDTVDWSDAAPGPGNLRVDLLLPGADVAVLRSGVVWPLPGAPLAEAVAAASRHRMVWADLDLR